jgi:hypothetical protein
VFEQGVVLTPSFHLEGIISAEAAEAVAVDPRAQRTTKNKEQRNLQIWLGPACNIGE